MIDRESSILAFNRRVLHQARREEVPLLERLRYITIVSSNLDEFFEVRYPDHLESMRQAASPVAAQTFAAVSDAAHALIDEQYRVFNEEVMPALAARGIRILNHADRNPAQRRWVARYFNTQVRPLLVPVALDPAHPFPLVANKSLNFILRLSGDGSDSTAGSVVIVKVPRTLPRVIRLPDRLVPRGEQGFVLLTSVIRAHLDGLIPGRRVEFFSQFRITRDADLDVDEDEVTNLRQALRTGLRTRQFGQAIRLEVVQSCPPMLASFLLQQFGLPPEALYKVNGPVNLVRLNALIDLADAPHLRFPPYEPGWPDGPWQPGASVFDALRQGDVLLHHPFQRFDPVIEFLRQAVEDPQVLAIKQTIYRTGSESVLMDLLLEAVRRGKDVTVVLELKARFDEEANINWAERLEGVGAQVVYGMVGLKTHAKLLLVTRRERPRQGAAVLRRYAHLSTGNYNPRTARLYTDVGLLTARPDITADVDAVFLTLSSLAPLPRLRRLVAAPSQLHGRMLALLRRVAAAARRGQDARVVLKVNSLTDPALIDGLVAASRAGASIDLIVRGACTLRPGVAGDTEHIRVRSVIGRFLEHTRVFHFRWGEGPRQQALYLSSADWMTRNMLRRVEVAWPVDDPVLHRRVLQECLEPYLRDDTDGWELHADGQYTTAAGAGTAAQHLLMGLLGHQEPT
ncbi:MAG: polyphosphate kinase [Pseudomonadota bacterium]|jgi:polyphosphate kinase